MQVYHMYVICIDIHNLYNIHIDSSNIHCPKAQRLSLCTWTSGEDTQHLSDFPLGQDPAKSNVQLKKSVKKTSKTEVDFQIPCGQLLTYHMLCSMIIYNLCWKNNIGTIEILMASAYATPSPKNKYETGADKKFWTAEARKPKCLP